MYQAMLIPYLPLVRELDPIDKERPLLWRDLYPPYSRLIEHRFEV